MLLLSTCSAWSKDSFEGLKRALASPGIANRVYTAGISVPKRCNRFFCYLKHESIPFRVPKKTSAIVCEVITIWIVPPSTPLFFGRTISLKSQESYLLPVLKPICCNASTFYMFSMIQRFLWRVKRALASPGIANRVYTAGISVSYAVLLVQHFMYLLYIMSVIFHF